MNTLKTAWTIFITIIAGILGFFLYQINAEQSSGLDLLIEVATPCRLQDTRKECDAKQRVTNEEEGNRRIVEVDCAIRRALAKLPAPDPKSSCVEQTPVEVYPGVDRSGLIIRRIP